MSGKIIAAIILIALVVSYVVDRQNHINDANRQHDSLVTACVRGDVQKSLGANGWLLAAEARRADGNKLKAAQYEATADGMIGTIPVPKDYDTKHPRKIAEVRFVYDPPHSYYVVTDEAAKLQKAGCEEAYPG